MASPECASLAGPLPLPPLLPLSLFPVQAVEEYEKAADFFKGENQRRCVLSVYAHSHSHTHTAQYCVVVSHIFWLVPTLVHVLRTHMHMLTQHTIGEVN